jgi:hypothetical protein
MKIMPFPLGYRFLPINQILIKFMLIIIVIINHFINNYCHLNKNVKFLGVINDYKQLNIVNFNG